MRAMSVALGLCAVVVADLAGCDDATTGGGDARPGDGAREGLVFTDARSGVDGGVGRDQFGSDQLGSDFIDVVGDGGSRCEAGMSQVCATVHPGECAEGTQSCEQGVWGACVAKASPGGQPEACGNGLDDDCDGSTDAADSDCRDCQPGQKEICTTVHPGLCAEGKKACVLAEGGGAYSFGPCVPDTLPGAEPELRGQPSCSDGKDNDCDGVEDTQDSDCSSCAGKDPEACNTGLPGVCNDGSRSCAGADWGPCVPAFKPGEQAEDCSKKETDDDCDGLLPAQDGDCHSCINGQKDPGEGGVDCGGNCPLLCGDGASCSVGMDCESGYCDGQTQKCAPPPYSCAPWVSGRRCTSGQRVLQFSGIGRDECRQLCELRKLECCAYHAAMTRCSYNNGPVTFVANSTGWIAARCN